MTVSSMLPQWSSSTLSDVTTIIRGVTYKKAQASNQPFTDSLAILRANNIQGGNVIASDLVYVPSDLVKPHQRLLKGDIVVAMSSGSKAVVGKTARIKEDFDGSFGAFCGVLRPVSKVIPTYLAWFTHSLEYRNRISSLSAGANINNLKPSHFDEIQIPIAPLAEQNVIADKLDTLLAQVENTKARLERIPQILKRFRQSVLAAAVSGRLTEEWRSEHAITEDSWGIQAASGLCEKVQSGSTPKNNPFDQNGTVPFLKVYNIVNQEIDFEYRPQFITEEVHQTKLKRSIGYPGDVLMNIVGPPLGKVAILPDTYPEWNLNQAITLFRPDPQKMLPKFLYYVLCEGSMVRDVTHDLKGIVGQVNISLTQCREAKIPCPTLPEQTEIVRRVDQLFAHADRIEQQVNNALARVNNLTQSILAKAFRGELTEQWRKDNPEMISGDNSAEALLDRIKAERAAQQPKKKTRARKASH